MKCKRILVGIFYKPPNSSPDYFELLKESIDRACNTDIIDIIITGDFNCNMAQSIPNKMRELMSEYNLSQLISDDTHFTEHSSSLLDLILVRNKENILMSGVVDPLIQQVRYYCPVMVLLKFTPPRASSFKRKIWYYKLADYNKFRELLSEASLENLIQSNDNINQNIQDITDAIVSAAEKSIPNKIVTVKPNESPWITCHIKSLIRKRRRIFQQSKKQNLITFEKNITSLETKLSKKLENSKQEYFDKLDRLLSSDNHDPKLF